jgi:hypothetical protein
MAALTYNLKKYMKWNSRNSVVTVMELNVTLMNLEKGPKRALKSLLSQLIAWQTW